MEISHLGHACLLIEDGDQRVLIDPGNFSDVSGVRDLTAVVVTHQHRDHCDPAQVPELLAANPLARVLLEPQTARTPEATGLGDRVEELAAEQTIELGHLRLRAVGELHAENHPYVERVGNLGVVLSGDGRPTIFHPGDALDAEPGEVDVLCVPVNAPWGRVAQSIEFVRRLTPGRGIIPIHDGLLNDAGRSMYVNHIGSFGADGGVEVFNLRGQGPTVF